MFPWISAMLPTVMRVGALGAKVGGITATAFGIRQIWRNANEQQSWQAKAMLSTLYALHMGSITLTTAVLLGATDVTAPVATAIVCSTALIKNVADLLVEKKHCLSLEKKHSDLTLKHTVDDKEFSFNLTLVEDRKETEEIVVHLEAKLNESQSMLQEILKLRAFKKKETLERLVEIRENLVQRNQEALKKSAIVQSYFMDIDMDTFDVITAIQVLLNKSAQLSELQRENPEDESISQKLVKNSIIQLQCIKYKKWQKIRVEIEQQLLSLIAPENTADREYLQQRKKELNDKMHSLWQGNIDLPKVHLQKVIAGKLPKTIKKNLQSYLKAEIVFLRLKLTAQQTLLAEKRRYVSDPVNLLPLADQIIDLTATGKELSLKRLSEKMKSKHVDLGALSAGLALTLAVAPSPVMSRALNPIMLSIGWIAGIASLHDLYRKYQSTHKASQSQSKRVKQFLGDKRFAIAQTNHDHLRISLTKQIDSLLTERTPSSVEVSHVAPTMITYLHTGKSESHNQTHIPITRAKNAVQRLLNKM